MVVDGPDLDALESASDAQIRARELGKIRCINSQSSPKRLCPWVDRKIQPLRCSTRIPMVSIISQTVGFGRITGGSWKIHRMDLWIFLGYLFFGSDR